MLYFHFFLSGLLIFHLIKCDIMSNQVIFNIPVDFIFNNARIMYERQLSLSKIGGVQSNPGASSGLTDGDGG